MLEETPSARLNRLQDRQRELGAALEATRHQQTLTRKDESEARLVAAGYDHSTRPHEMAMRDAAKIRLASIQEQAKAESDRIATLESELAEVKAGIAALFDGREGYAAAVSIYREAKMRAAAAEAALQAHQAKQHAAAMALEEAQKTTAAATRARADAMDADSINRARAALETARHAEDDAQTLVENLLRKVREIDTERATAVEATKKARQKAFEVKAAMLAEEIKQRLTGPVLEAFAAARLAGSGWSFWEWLAEMIDPAREHVPAATEAHRAALVAELESAGGDGS
jgi:chromosome segregation ATPase